MRHGKKFNHLSRKAGHRAALLKNLAIALIEHKRINTTLAKAKALRVYIEPLLTKSKDNTTHSRRTVFSYLGNKNAITELFDVIGPKVMDRPGGYLRILKMGFRRGDAADMAMIELVDFNELMLANKKAEATKSVKKTRRRSAAKQEKAVEQVEEIKVNKEVISEEIIEPKLEQQEETQQEDGSKED
jgi:large subunit ribosomal protein L17